MKMAILGGSFNPIHIGHLALADDVCVTLGYDKILFVPTATPPHKAMREIVPAQDRLGMVKAACSEDERFIAEGCEIERGGVSYTCDTIKILEEKYKDTLEGKLGLIMGEDLLPDFHLWNRAEEIAQRCTLIVARRPYKQESALFANKNVGDYGKTNQLEFDITKEPLFNNCVAIENPLLTISSTDIRERISCGKSFEYLVPRPVFRYIIDGKLYGHR